MFNQASKSHEFRGRGETYNRMYFSFLRVDGPLTFERGVEGANKRQLIVCH